MPALMPYNIASLADETILLAVSPLRFIPIDPYTVKISVVAQKIPRNARNTSGDSINTDEVVARQDLHQVNARAVDECSLLEIPIS